MRKQISAFLLALILVSGSACGVWAVSGFSDVPENQWYSEAVETLTTRGVLSGYQDDAATGTRSFRPDRTLTRGEFLALVVRLENAQISTCDTGHWALNYYDRAVALGLIKESEMDDAASELDGAITRYEMALILARMAEMIMGEPPVVTTGIADYIADYGTIPENYRKAVEQAYARGILTGFEDGTFRGSQHLTRAEAAVALLRLLDEDERLVNPEDLAGLFAGGLVVQGQELYLGMTVEELTALVGAPDEIRQGRLDLSLYHYDLDRYENFFIAEVSFNGYVVSLYTVGRNYRVIEETGAKITYYQDDFDGREIYGAAVTINAGLAQYGLTEVTTEDYNRKCEDFAMVSFYYANAYRVFHGRTPLALSETATVAAAQKAADMSGRDYFEHTSPDGVTHRDLLYSLGLDVDEEYTGENICAGYRTGFYAANAWIHSEGHRQVLLYEIFDYAGVGMAYNPDSYYEVYFTMIFYGN